MLSSTLHPHIKQEARLFVLFVLFNVSCIVAQKIVNIIQGNIPITKHILNVITNDFASVLTLHFPAMPNTQFALKIFNQPFLLNQRAVKEIYD